MIDILENKLIKNKSLIESMKSLAAVYIYIYIYIVYCLLENKNKKSINILYKDKTILEIDIGLSLIALVLNKEKSCRAGPEISKKIQIAKYVSATRGLRQKYRKVAIQL